MSESERLIELAERYSAHSYHPLPVVVAEAEGAWVTDVEGRRYLDMLAAYSALNFGHRHPDLIAAAKRQLDRVTLTSRAFHNDLFGPFCEQLADLCGMDMVLPMNTGAEGVETALKTARKWGYEVKGVAPGRAKIVVADGNFHGRTITIISFSTDPASRDPFGPLTPGFQVVPYGDVEALRAAIDDDTVAFLVEPIQGEAGVIVPPDGYLRAAREICTERAGAPLGSRSIPIHRPRPRTSVTFAGTLAWSFSMNAGPRRAARSWYSPVRSRRSTSSPTAHASGFPPKVDPCSPGRNTPSTSLRETTAESGTIPPPSALPRMYASGTTPSCSHANVVPVRPRPDWISSAMRRTPRSVQTSRAARR
jgi:hypothetical protein